MSLPWTHLKPGLAKNESILTGHPMKNSILDDETKSPITGSPVLDKKTDNSDEAEIRHLATIVESSEDAIISKSLDGCIRTWNRGSEKMFGYTAQYAIGKHISLIIPQEFIDDENKIVDRIQHNEFIHHYETVRLRKNGERFFVSLTVSPIHNKGGEVTGISKIARDITLRKISEEALATANNKLSLQNQEREARAEELVVANLELVFQHEEKAKRASELILANEELGYQNEEKENVR